MIEIIKVIYQCIVSLNSKFIFYSLLYKNGSGLFKFLPLDKKLYQYREVEILESYCRRKGFCFLDPMCSLDRVL